MEGRVTIQNVKFYKTGIKFFDIKFDDKSKITLNKEELKIKTNFDDDFIKTIIQNMEFYKVKIVNDILFMLITGSNDQFGILIGFDIKQKEIIHISNAMYVIDFDLDNNYLYNLHYVHNFAIKPFYAYSRVSINRVDYNTEPKMIELKNIEIDENNIKNKITIKDKQLLIDINNMQYKIDVK